MPRFILKYPVAGTTEVIVDGETEKEAIANYEEGTGYDPEKDYYHDHYQNGDFEIIGYYDDEGNYEER